MRARICLIGKPTEGYRCYTQRNLTLGVVDRCNCRRHHRRLTCRPWRIFPAADIAFALVFAVPSEGGTGSVEALAAATSVAQHAPCPSSTSHGADSAAITDPAASAPSPHGDPAPTAALPPSGRISTRTCRKTAVAAGAKPLAVD